MNVILLNQTFPNFLMKPAGSDRPKIAAFTKLCPIPSFDLLILQFLHLQASSFKLFKSG